MVTQKMSNKEEEEEDTDDIRKHLEGVEDGAGCVEIWERLSEQREKK